jgi:hypothetical protein
MLSEQLDGDIPKETLRSIYKTIKLVQKSPNLKPSKPLQIEEKSKGICDLKEGLSR